MFVLLRDAPAAAVVSDARHALVSDLDAAAWCRTAIDRNAPVLISGRTRHKAGYLMVRAPEHPRARTSRYVFEHILVAEELLGRYLEPGESIHHRNGVRDDNRAENLELWTRPQPTGIRASDAIAWAHAILDRYDAWGPGTPPTMLTDEP